MSLSNLKISRKQKLALDLLEDPQIVELDYGGGAGGAKTFLVCLWAVLECRRYAGIRIGLGRKEMVRLKQTTLYTLLRKVHPLMGVFSFDYTYQEGKGLVTYRNGSEIQLVDLAYQPSDPDYDTLGSLEFTHAIIEEAGEIKKKAKTVLGSRINRYRNEEYGITGKLILTQNPSQNFTRDEYYEPYKLMGGGDYQKWENGEVEVNGLMLPAYRVFVRALVKDNPFAPRNYVERLRSLPSQERKRLYEGDWDYIDDENNMIKAYVLERAWTGMFETGRMTMGVDVADIGKDETVMSLIDNGVLVEQHAFKADTASPVPISEQTAMEIIKFAQQNGFSANTARDIGIDVVGIGVGVRDFMKQRGWQISEYIAGSKGKVGYRNLRSQSYWELAQALENGKLQLYNKLTTTTQLRKQLLAHEVKFEDKMISVVGKDKLKEVIGRSPDHADSLCIAYWVYAKVNQPTKVLF